MAGGVQGVLILSIVVCVLGAAIEHVDDTDLIHLLNGEDNLIALFTKANCKECNELEAIVENVQGDLKQHLGAVVVQAHNSHVVNIYDPSKEPSLIYFRKGIPLLFYGTPSEEEILNMFSENRDPVVKELSDENFEHLTQAATGATTGDWFIYFYSADCVTCQRLYAVWETVGAKLKHRLNVARINRSEAGYSTAKRFGITKSPEFVLIRLGKFYRYKLNEFTPKSLIEFAESGYQKQTDPENVPDLPNFMDDLFTDRMQFLGDNPKYIVFGLLSLLLFISLGFIIKRLSQKQSKSLTKKIKKSK